MATISGGDKLQSALDGIARNLDKAVSVEVGFMEGATYPDGTSVPLVAALDEFGTAKSPPRPFFRNAIAQNSAKWPKNLATALRAMNYDTAKALDLVGQEIQEELQDSIRSNTPPPNAPATVEKKGFDRTLIDSSVMLNSVTHRVKS
jgi:HK97 gp10 family phage protein